MQALKSIRFGPGVGWIRPSLSACLILIAGILAIGEADAAPVKVSENSGVVCFRDSPAGVYADFNPFLGCLSSSCTRRLETHFTARVDERVGEIALRSRFVVQPLGGRDRICTADCGGAGRGSVNLGGLKKGLWRVRLGDLVIGMLDTDAAPNSDPAARCLASPRPEALGKSRTH